MSDRPDLPDDGELVRGCQRGDRNAFSLLFRKYLGRVIGYSVSLIGNRDESKDIAQEAFIKAFHGIASFRGEGSFIHWLLTITRRTAIDFIRRKNPTDKKTVLPGEDRLRNLSSPGQESTEGFPERIGILAGLTPIEREVMVLRCVDELSYGEIAKITGLTEGSLRKVLCRALGKASEEAKSGGMP